MENIPEEKIVDLEVNMDEVSKAAKNTDGHLGKICNTCGGFGFTLTIGGTGSAGCNACAQTGVAAMTNGELQAQVIGLAADIKTIKDIILKFAKENE